MKRIELKIYIERGEIISYRDMLKRKKRSRQISLSK